ncbi:hypothetical protein EYZ11_006586 [Aspergillus tanneri]|uniref:Nudix hydrolase domain-containing protein n=1 Tax=Aspergillus tanneri TaxID=1220188 RepID=A0A4S3JF43_9EURO|nr:uncharacterized protein ATNIH1004_008189 [Aspergillus tanneri]KAA8643993.1 hypothetical protein ATNIH1004_008189 [Aspergillus tanneri]THC93939.1 hypothetical protein EYZ11_006586 [Aspergillus tanneri]
MATAQPNLEKRDVVSSFIFHFPPGKPSNPVVALFRRSDKVNTYQHHLAPISGTISQKDKDPLTAAWRELAEETTLTPSNLTLWRTGKPFTFRDPSVGREWTVHPFAFRLDGPESAIQTDWEHERWEWYDPRAVRDEANFGGVPRLKESLCRVWFEGAMSEPASQILSTGLNRLRTDHKSGANELTAIALNVFRDFIMHTRNALDETWWTTVRMVAWHLVKNGRESMGAATLNAVLAVLTEIEKILQVRGDMAVTEQEWDRILPMMDFQVSKRASNKKRVMKSFTSYLRSRFLGNGMGETLTILTMSSSSTIQDSILDAFAALDIQMLELRVLESRPLFEGTSYASSILCRLKSQFQTSDKKTLKVRMYTDASAALAAEGVDIVLLGADRISAQKGVSNKTGSLPLVLSTKQVAPSVQVVVLSGLEKINGTSGFIDDDEPEDYGPAEVVNTWRNDGIEGVDILEQAMENGIVEVENVYFEWVPFSLVDAFVCEDGILDVGSLQERSRQLREMVDRYFGDL